MSETKLFDAAIAFSKAKKELAETWRRSDFNRLLVANLESERLRIVEPPTDEYELQSGRGTGPIIKLDYAAQNAVEPSVMNIGIRVTYEAEGGDTKTVSYSLQPPVVLFQRTTKRAFTAWAKKERARILQVACREAQDVVNDLHKRIGWNR